MLNCPTPEAMEHLFSELLADTVTATALHAITNAFLIYKGSKASETFLSETIKSSTISTTGIAAGMSMEMLLNQVAWAGGPPTYALVFVTSFSTRAIAKRLFNRADSITWVLNSNAHLESLTIHLTNQRRPIKNPQAAF
jgi:hypothetical protein